MSQPGDQPRVLVTGWFSYFHGEATAGDLMAASVAAAWLEDAGIHHDTAVSPILGAPRTLDDVDPAAYSHLVFVCGPLAGHQVLDLAARFGRSVTIALGVSVVDASVAAAFDVVIPRDGLGQCHPDLAFAAEPVPGLAAKERPGPVPGPAAEAVSRPVVGVVKANQQPEYQASAHHRVHAAIDDLLDQQVGRSVAIDTRVDPRAAGQRSPGEVEEHFVGLDAVVSTRLHGLVLGLRCGVPVLAVDPIPGGGKVTAQARALGWPALLAAGASGPARLADALDYCLSSEARQRAGAVVFDARRDLAALRHQLVRAVRLRPR